jgi:chromosome segregation ATPase
LAVSPELLSLFLVSDNGDTFLSETSRQLLQEQAARTSELLSDYRYSSELGDIGVLDLESDFSARTERINEFLDEENVPYEELRAMLRQEVLVSSSLRRYVERLLQRNNEFRPSGGSKEGKYVELLKADSDLDRDIMAFEREIKRKTTRLRDLKEKSEAIQQQIKEYSSLIEAQNADLGDVTRQMASINATLAEESKYIKSRGYSERTDRHVTNDGPENQENWNRWARRLYTGITKLKGQNVSERGLKIVIEEAALTSVGCQKLRDLLNLAEEGAEELNLSGLLTSVRAGIRMQKEARSYSPTRTRVKRSGH